MAVQTNVVQHPRHTPLTPLQQQQGNAYPYGTYPSTWVVPNGESERLRFALELIADNDLTHEAIKKIARAALRREAKKS